MQKACSLRYYEVNSRAWPGLKSCPPPGENLNTELPLILSSIPHWFFRLWFYGTALPKDPYWGRWDLFQQHTMSPSLSDKARNPSHGDVLSCSSQTKVKPPFEKNSASQMLPSPPHLPSRQWSCFRLATGLRVNWALGQDLGSWSAPGKQRTPEWPLKEGLKRSDDTTVCNRKLNPTEAPREQGLVSLMLSQGWAKVPEPKSSNVWCSAGAQ